MSIFEQLEPRILLSADIVPLPADTDLSDTEIPLEALSLSENQAAPTLSESADTASAEEKDDQQSDLQTEGTAASDPGTEDATGEEIIFINDDIEGAAALAEGLGESTESTVIILDSSEDGITQISSALENIEASAIHLFTHGTEGNLRIGSTWISQNSIEDYRDSISGWGNSLTEDGDILLYGCDLAADEEGEALVGRIAELTGADVAASSDTTGAAAKGGDWILEYETGEIETAVAVNPSLQDDWVHILAEEYVADSFDTGDYSGSDGSVAWAGDWVEIGESDGESNGNVRIEDGRLYIQAADNDEALRGIYRVADLSNADSAYLSFYLDDVWAGSGCEVNIEVWSETDADWVVLEEHNIAPYSAATQMRFDISEYISSETTVRFISEGSDFGGLSSGNAEFYVDNLRIDYTTDTWSSVLWLSTEGDVDEGGQDNVDTWENSDMIGLNNSSPSLGSETDGEFSLTARLSAFAEGANIDGLHYVTTTMLIGESAYQLERGDILFISSDATPTSFGGIDASGSDVILFRPGSEGDYSSGTFSILFDDLTTRNVTGITLVESGVTIGDRDLATGDLLFTSDDNKIYHFATTDVELGGSTSGTESILLDGDDAGIAISTELQGIDVIERSLTIGNIELEQGTLLLSAAESDDVGDNTLTVSGNDIFALEVTTTSSTDGSTADLGSASASHFLDGSDVSFDSARENIDAFSLTVESETSGPVFTGAYFDADERTITLVGENLDYLGDIGENVKSRIDWTKIIWDVNGDGDVTDNIDFELQDVSTVLTSESTLVIHLTGQKSNEITGTDDYGSEGGTDTITILPGFSSNESGEVATTDGLLGAVIYTTTGPTGITLSQLALAENTDTSGGTVVGTLSSTDSDDGESFTYTITGGADADFFRLNGDELIIDAGVLDYETKSSYVVAVTTTDSSDQSFTETFTIAVVDINETPGITSNNLTISEGGTVTLTSANLLAEDPESTAGSLILTVTNLSGGYFSHADTGLTTEFSQSDVSLGRIRFIHDGSEDAPSYTITVSDGFSQSAASSGDITFSNVNDGAEILTNSLTVTEGARVTLTSTDLEIVDPDTAPDELLFTVVSVSGGQFELASDHGNSISSFTLAQVNSGEVEYVHNGGETAAAYTLSLDDRGITVGPSIADITYSGVNDSPTLQSNYIPINQSSNLLITSAHLLAEDPDVSGSADLTYDITNIEHGYFRVNGFIDTSFTQADIDAGVVVFYQDGSANEPGFSIEVTDGDGGSSGVIGANVSFNIVNQPPVFHHANLTVSEGETVILSSGDFYTTDTDTINSGLRYTITSCDGGYFELTTNPGVAVTSFTQLAINQGDVRFVHDGGEAAPTFGVTVSDGEYTESPGESNIDFTNLNDAPVITANTLTIAEGGEVTLDTPNLSATDPDSPLGALRFYITDISGGNFFLQGSDTVVDEFTRAQIDAGDIVFIHDGGEDAPEFRVTVSDGELSSATGTATINFSPANDAPVLVNNSFTVTEGGSVVLDTTNISATDIDSVDANLTFTVTEVEGGHFAHSSAVAVSIGSFTQAEILDGDIIFVHNGSETQPTYQVTVTDDAFDALNSTPESGNVTLIPVNDAPQLTHNALTISEGETLRVNSSMLGASDSDSDQTELNYTVSDLVAGIFVHEDDLETPITHFSQTDLDSGRIFIIHDGSETPLAYTISVSDGKDSSPPSPAIVVFNHINDAPTITNTATNQTYLEDSPRLLSGISVEDTDGGTAYQVTLELSNIHAGSLSEGSEGTADSTFSGTTLTITGTDIDDVNSLLASTVFTPAADYEGDVTITMNATDGQNPADAGTRTLHAITNNDAPVATHLTQSGTYTENLTYNLDNIVVSDADHNETITATMTLASPDLGSLTTAGGAFYDSDSGVWTISGSISEVNSALAAVSFVPAADSTEDTSISIVIEDGSEDGVVPLTGTVSLTGSTNEAPQANTDGGTTEEGAVVEGGTPSTGEDSTREENIEQVADTEVLLEQLDVVDTNTTVPATTGEPVAATPAEETSESSDKESQSDTEPEAEETAESGRTYINAHTISEPDDDTTIEIFANFDKLSTDLSLGSIRIQSFSFSTNEAPSVQDTGSTARLSEDVTPHPGFSTSDYSLIDLEYRDRSFEEYQSVRQSLDIFKEETENETTAERTVIGSAIAASTGLSAGYVIWLLRSGALLSSLLSSIPAWQLTDPLAVLGNTKGAIDEDDDSLESIIEKGAEPSVPNTAKTSGKNSARQHPHE